MKPDGYNQRLKRFATQMAEIYTQEVIQSAYGDNRFPPIKSQPYARQNKWFAKRSPAQQDREFLGYARGRAKHLRRWMKRNRVASANDVVSKLPGRDWWAVWLVRTLEIREACPLLEKLLIENEDQDFVLAIFDLLSLTPSEELSELSKRLALSSPFLFGVFSWIENPEFVQVYEQIAQNDQYPEDSRNTARQQLAFYQGP